MNTPEEAPFPPDDLERLEQLHQKMKDEAEAWQKLLKNLGKMRTRDTENTEPKKPNT